MTEEKRNRIIVAVTVNLVVLVFILIAVVVAQLVTIGVLNRRKQELLDEYTVYEDELKTAEDLAEKLENDEAFRKWYLQYIETLGDEDPLNILP